MKDYLESRFSNLTDRAFVLLIKIVKHNGVLNYSLLIFIVVLITNGIGMCGTKQFLLDATSPVNILTSALNLVLLIILKL